MPARRPRGLMRKLSLMLGVMLAVLMVGGSSAMAETGKKALILESSVSGGASSPEADRATALGFTVTVASDAIWAGMTASQFSDYQLLIVGDPTCSSLPAAVSQNAVALADAVMDHGTLADLTAGCVGGVPDDALAGADLNEFPADSGLFCGL